MKHLKNKTIWITGASAGIGEALAKALAIEGANLVLTARREDELNRVASETGLPQEKIMILPADVTHLDETASLTNQVIQRFGTIDILVNNAGRSSRALAAETPIEIDQQLMKLNYFAPVALTKAVLPQMIKQGSGHIVVTSSVMGKFGTPLRSAYSASKHALHGFFDTLREEVSDKGIRVTILCPGYIKTEVSINSITANGDNYNKMSRYQQNGTSPEKLARRVVKGIKRGKREIWYGGIEILGLYLHRISPYLLYQYLKTQHRKNAFLE
ncbi:MAG: SDR family oxidoreductase [Bacteroidales bacterium]|nr:SDR family oxidoreductase [Bacteroidales bacterium]